MNSTNKTLYIPLYGKAFVSRQGRILSDKKAEEIWNKEGFPLQGKPKSRWLAYYMAMRAWVMDTWLEEKLQEEPQAQILHLGCGLDSRCLRVETENLWFDVDMPAVAEIRKKHYNETETYRIIAADVCDDTWLEQLPSSDSALVVMEGLSMYLPKEELKSLLQRLQKKYTKLHLIMDVYTELGVKASAWKNPIQAVGASVCSGVDEPKEMETGALRFVQQMNMTPDEKINELHGLEKGFFRMMFTGKTSNAIYRIYTYKKECD